MLQVTVFWRDAGGQLGHANTTLHFPASSPRFPAVRPRPRPCEIWWGRMFHDELLVPAYPMWLKHVSFLG